MKSLVHAHTVLMVLALLLLVAGTTWILTVRENDDSLSPPPVLAATAHALDTEPASRITALDDGDNDIPPECDPDPTDPRRQAANTEEPDIAATTLDPASTTTLDATNTSPPRIAGSIRGVLLREGGPWTTDTLPKSDWVLLDLAPTSNPRASVRGRIEIQSDARGEHLLSFEFADLVEGEYELTLSTIESWRWGPTTLRVRPPLSGVTFTRFDKDPRRPLAFAVSDASTGNPISAYQSRHVQITPSTESGVFLHTGPLELDQFPIDAHFSWSVWADGYAPAFGDETAFVLHDDKRVADIRLQPGWGTRMLVLGRDPHARLLRGVSILLDGQIAGTTGADGMIALHAPHAPTSIDVLLEGWSAISDPLQPYLGKTAAQRGQITIVMLERD